MMHFETDEGDEVVVQSGNIRGGVSHLMSCFHVLPRNAY